MKLTQNVVDRLISAQSRLSRIRGQFERFYKSLDFLAEPNCPIHGITLTKTGDASFCIVSFETVSVGLRFLQTFNSSGLASGRMVATLESPKFTATPTVLGSVTFNPQGLTDFEFEDGADPLDMDTHAVVIALHFVHLALERSAD